MSSSVTELRIQRCTGEALLPHLPALARLRIEVFREFPYLYDGTQAYEERYLARFARARGSVIVLALDGEAVVGASTGLPLLEETEPIQRPFRAAGLDLASHFYFGESVLARPYRGRGAGVRFFEEREAHARSIPGIRHTCFCAVVRPEEHPRRPADYVPLDAFWTRRGYHARRELVAYLSWQDLDEDSESEKPLVFWSRSL
jgi:GNAT superfamily N-acetyltransferase